MTSLDDNSIWQKANEEGMEDLGQEILKASTDEINQLTRLLENEIKVIDTSEFMLLDSGIDSI